METLDTHVIPMLAGFLESKLSIYKEQKMITIALLWVQSCMNLSMLLDITMSRTDLIGMILCQSIWTDCQNVQREITGDKPMKML